MPAEPALVPSFGEGELLDEQAIPAAVDTRAIADKTA
jgi:hypothetical protein